MNLFLKSVLKGAGCGAGSGLLMALTEYVYLASTVEQFATGSELLVFGCGLLALFVCAGALIGSVLFAAMFPAAQWVIRRDCVKRFLEKRWVSLTGLFGALACFFFFFAVNARAYHRLYVGYHIALTVAGYLAGLLFIVSAVRLVRDQKLPLGKKAAVPGAIAAIVLTLVLLAATAPELAGRENLRAIISDRGVAAYHFLLLARRLTDGDGDGFARPPLGYDCDDGDRKRYPMAYDVPGDGVDQDCTGRDRAKPAPLPDPPPSVGEPRLIILLTIDAVRADRWPDSYSRNLLPNIYALARAGMVFTRAYAASNWTIPSVYSLFTGRYPSHVRFVMAAMDRQDRVHLVDPDSRYARDPGNIKRLIPVPAPNRTETLANALKKRGYVTATVLAIPFLSRQMGMAQGFDHVDATPYVAAGRPLTGATADKMTGAALRMIRRFAHEKLFFYMHYNDPHAPYRYHRRPTDLGRALKDRYDSEIRFVDSWVGVLLTALQKQGRLKQTLVIITSDHGEAFREHGGRFHASTVYEEQVRVPLVVYGPGIKKGTFGYPVSHVDLFPTVLSLLDGRSDRNLRAGVDLSDLLRTGAFTESMKRRVVYAESRRFLNFKQAAISSRFKIIRDNKAGATVLFDLDKDPGETRNRIGVHRSQGRRLLRAMNAILDSGQ